VKQVTRNLDSWGTADRLPEVKQLELLHQARRLALVSGPNAPDAHQLSKQVYGLLSRVRQNETRQVIEASYADVFRNLNPDQQKAYGKTIGIVQLTTGCTVGCPDCNFNASKNIRSKLSWDAINEIVDRFGDSLRENDVIMYYASDPLDWEDIQGRDYFDVQEMIFEKTGFLPEVTTAVPKGKEELARKLWRSKARVRISLSGVNKKRIGIQQIDEKWGDPGNPESHTISHGDRLLYKAGQSFNYAQINESIGCKDGGYVTPEGVWSIMSTDTSPIYPNGFVRFDLDESSKWFIDYRPSKNAHHSFTPVDGVFVDGTSGTLDSLFDNQIFHAIKESCFTADLADELYGRKSPTQEQFAEMERIKEQTGRPVNARIYTDQEVREEDAVAVLMTFMEYLDRTPAARDVLSKNNDRLTRIDDMKSYFQTTPEERDYMKENKKRFNLSTLLLVRDPSNPILDCVKRDGRLPAYNVLRAEFLAA
jgi:hypothetical protein